MNPSDVGQLGSAPWRRSGPRYQLECCVIRLDIRMHVRPGPFGPSSDGIGSRVAGGSPTAMCAVLRWLPLDLVVMVACIERPACGCGALGHFVPSAVRVFSDKEVADVYIWRPPADGGGRAVSCFLADHCGW